MSREETALVIADVQRDFLPGGALGVAGGDQVIEPLRARVNDVGLIVATRDYHPANHCSFHARGGPWPAHCVIGTPGAAIHPEIDAIAQLVVSKGMDAEREQYSAFDTGLGAMLHAHGVRRLIIGGLATDYCVRYTALGARQAGFEVEVIAEATRAVDVEPGDGERALTEMRAAGVVIV
ncbi:MAG TPA: isochorismatase family protein [Candidatus Dormibacteraeota bacterium]